MTDKAKRPPDRVCAESHSKYFHRNLAPIRVTIGGVEYTGRVMEYDKAKGWARVIDIDPKTGLAVTFAGFAGKRPRVHWKHGKIVAWYADQPIPADAIDPSKPQTVQVLPPEPEPPPPDYDHPRGGA